MYIPEQPDACVVEVVMVEAAHGVIMVVVYIHVRVMMVWVMARSSYL